ncbi:S8 family peptidase [Luteimonas sp. MC1825]|uniref:S8 family peptidase n=1 Tax=Luteimonas sp. MC1825 TaxID=2761107 RepID=UPI0016226AE4|nr:S8 family peptidase [Luteimonas sp. MC1825]MBB6598883.1 S8 family serine peptidase [Luteimonas sp. MC1825]QOC89030.1 S8 family serine peptidase [Luteimonas sp. MC1825]
MTRRTRSTTTTTALAVAIAAALVAAPAAYSAGRQPALGGGAKVSKAAKGPVFSKPALAYGTNLKAPTNEAHDSFIISFQKGAAPSAAALRNHLQAVGKTLGIQIAVDRDTATGAKLVRTSRALDRDGLKQLTIELMKSPMVRAVDPNGRMYRAMTPNDELFPQQWHYKGGGEGMNAVEAWDSVDGSGYIIAVLDTGQVDHADLAGQFIAGYDFISDPANARDNDGRDNNPNDEGDWDDKYDSSWHGTHVAGTVAALTNNTLGVAGVAHGAKVQHVRVLGNAGGTFADINDAIVWASGGTVPGVPVNPTPAHVINLSLGGSTVCPTAMQDAVNIAITNGTTVVAAAGNSSGDVAGFSPASCAGVIAVAGTGPNNTPYASTNFGPRINVAAPAGSGSTPATNQVLSTLNTGLEGQAEDSYAWYAGTSMASPHVAGTIALMLEAAGGDLDTPEIETILENTAYAANGLIPGCDNAERWCASMIDAGLAVAVAAGDEPLPPAPPAPPEPPPPTPLENGVTVNLPDMTANESLYFVLDVPADQGLLEFNLGAGTSGDSDIYVQYNQRPSNSVWQCRPWTGGTVSELCSFTAPTAGEWHVRVNAYTASAGYTLTGTYDEDGPEPPTTTVLQNGVTVSGLSIAAGQELFFVLDVPAGATDLKFQMAGSNGDADLYVRRGSLPTDTAYDCRPYLGGTNETCTIAAPEAGQWFVRLDGWSAATGVSLTGSYVGGPVGEAPTNVRGAYAFALKALRIRVPLYWDGGDGEQVDIKRNGVTVATVANTGYVMDTFTASAPGAGTVTYQVCNAGTTECNSATVNYTARR